MISIITPVFDESENLNELFSRIDKVFSNLKEKYEIIFVDNGSNDSSLDVIKGLAEKNSQIKFVSLTKNFGHQGGIWAGLNHTTNTCIIMDSDLQHPPEVIPKLIEKWHKGFKVVNTRKNVDRDNRIWKKFFASLFYKIINSVTNLNLSTGQSDYCLIDSSVLSVLKQLPEKKIFLRGIVNSLGFETTTVQYDTEARKSGKSKFSKVEYIDLALNGILSYSSAPVSIFFWVGIIISLFCVGYIIYIGTIYYFLNNYIDMPPGWATILVSILFFGSIQLMALGILGKYLILILENGKKRPEFIVKEKKTD